MDGATIGTKGRLRGGLLMGVLGRLFGLGGGLTFGENIDTISSTALLNDVTATADLAMIAGTPVRTFPSSTPDRVMASKRASIRA